jgi:two-component system nitrate/nitrite response regulator NarL
VIVDTPQLPRANRPAALGSANFLGATMYHDLCLISPSDISREGLSSILRNEGFTIVGSYLDHTELRSDVIDRPVVVVIDDPLSSNLPEIVEQTLASLPESIIVILAPKFDLSAMLDCFRAGAKGFIIKSTRAEPMIAALRLAAAGERVLPSDLVDIFDKRSSMHNPMIELGSNPAVTKLSQREDDVLCLSLIHI